MAENPINENKIKHEYPEPKEQKPSEANTEIWGEILPGTVFWQETKAPENAALLDADNRARKLEAKELKAVQAKLKSYLAALEEWAYRSYPARLHYYQQMLKQALAQRDKRSARDWQKRLKALEAAPPTKPIQNRFLGIFPRKQSFVPIQNEREAQKLRLWIANAEKRLKEHETALQNEKIYEELAYEMQLEVAHFGSQIVKRWSALANREEFYVNGKRKIKLVKFEEAHYTPDEIQYKIKVSSRGILGTVLHHLPDRVSAWNLVKPETLSELAAACERPIGTPNDENTPMAFEKGAWVIVYREGLTDGLFDYVDYERVITKYEPEKRHKFPIPIGVKRGRIVHWLYLSSQPHLMVNGVPGSGKTNMIRVILTTICQYHSPDEMRFYIVDLKRGGDFQMFAETSHLAAPIIKQIEALAEMIPHLVAMMQKRMDTMADCGALDIDDYNRMVSPEKRMPRVLLVIDECNSIDNLSFGKSSRDTIWRGLTLIATQSRAAGIHLVLGTQQTSGDAIPGRVRDNITFALSGRQRTLGGSMSTFGSGKAKKLPNIRGRMICDDGSDEFQVQTPEVTRETLNRAVEISKAYGDLGNLALPSLDEEEAAAILSEEKFTWEDVVRIAISEFDGAMNQHKIHAMDEVPEHVSRNNVKAMIDEIVARRFVQFEGSEYVARVYGRGYRLMLNSENSEQNTELPANTDAAHGSSESSSAVNELAIIPTSLEDNLESSLEKEDLYENVSD